MKIIFLFLFLVLWTSYNFTQDITNTLAPNGEFKVKDNTTDYLNISQSTGNLSLLRNLELGSLLNSTSTIGVITKNGQRFIHNYNQVNGDGFNTFVGINSGNFIMGGSNSYFGSYNTAAGAFALTTNTTGYFNSAFGDQSLYSNTEGNSNSAYGHGTLFSNLTGSFNSAFGANALVNNTSGYGNSSFGEHALYSNISGHYNSAFGYTALQSITTGQDNSAFGKASLYSCNGFGNAGIGDYALQNMTTGSYNTALGYSAGTQITTGNNNIVIGYSAQVLNGNSDNQVRIGNTNIGYAGIQVAWSVTSDRRWKENIQPTNLGLRFITKLNPVSYTRKNDENHRTEYGLIAQELEEILKKEGIENAGMLTITDEGYYELRYNDLLAPMIRAIQELNEKNEQLVVKNEELEIKNASLEERLAKYEETQAMLVKELEQIKSNQKDFKV